MQKRVIQGLLAGLVLAGTAGTTVAKEIDGEAMLRQFVEETTTLSAEFEQSLVDADGNVAEESEGTLELHRPGRFRWSYRTPYEQLLVADGLNVWSYDIDLEQVTVKAQAEVLANTPAILLGGGGDVLDDFELVDAFEDRGTDWLRLRPSASAGSFDSVELGFTNGTLSRMIFLDSLGQSTLIALYNVQVNETIAGDRFMFEPPLTADLVGQPVVAAGEPGS